MSNTFKQSFPASQIPAGMKELVKLTGLRPANILVEFQEGETTVGGAWSVDAVTLTGKLQGKKVTHWTGSDGESNTYVEATYTGPVAQGSKGHGKRKSSVTVTVGNLGELVPSATVSPEVLNVLWLTAIVSWANTTVEQVTYVEPGPFTREDIKVTTETDRKVIIERNADGSEVEVVNIAMTGGAKIVAVTTPAPINPQVEFLMGLGIE